MVAARNLWMVAYSGWRYGNGRYLPGTNAWPWHGHRAAASRLRAGGSRRTSLFRFAELLGHVDRCCLLLAGGWLFDRYDQRLILIGNLLLLGLAVLGMSAAHTWMTLFITLILTRGLGQSALSVVSLTIVAKAFEPRRVGLAMAWYAILSVPYHLLLIKGVGWAQADGDWGWREIWSVVGVSLMAMSVWLSGLKRQSREYSVNNVEQEPGWTLVEALQTPAFWLFSLTISIWGMIYYGVVALFNVDIFKERGFDEKLYFNVLSVITVVALVSKLVVFGWLCESCFTYPTPGYMLAVDGVFARCNAAGLTAMACIRVCIDSRHCIRGQ